MPRAEVTACPTYLRPELVDRAEKSSVLHGRTHVVLSFGARNGGAYFGKWLRYMIMKREGWTRKNSVYLDTECLKGVPDTTYNVVDASRPWLIGVASLNPGWKEYYRYAMHQAGAMIFAATPEWSDSTYCAQEKRYYIYENAWRRRNRQPPLRAVELSLGGYRINIPGATVITAEKVDAELECQPRHVVQHRANHNAAARFGVNLVSQEIPSNKEFKGNYTIAGRPLLQLCTAIRGTAFGTNVRAVDIARPLHRR